MATAQWWFLMARTYHNCCDCGRRFLGGRAAKRCPECAKKRNRNKNRERDRKVRSHTTIGQFDRRAAQAIDRAVAKNDAPMRHVPVTEFLRDLGYKTEEQYHADFPRRANPATGEHVRAAQGAAR